DRVGRLRSTAKTPRRRALCAERAAPGAHSCSRLGAVAGGAISPRASGGVARLAEELREPPHGSVPPGPVRNSERRDSRPALESGTPSRDLALEHVASQLQRAQGEATEETRVACIDARLRDRLTKRVFGWVE